MIKAYFIPVWLVGLQRGKQNMTSANIFDDLKEDYYLPFFYVAFHPYQTLAAGTVLLGLFGYYQNSVTAYSILGLFVIGPVSWIVGVHFTNSNYQELLDAFLDDAAKEATELFAGAGEDTETYHIEHSYGSVNLVQPDRVYEPITLIVSETSVLVYDDTRLDFDVLRANYGSSTREVFYDSVTSVNYDSPYFEIRLQDGDTAKYRSSRKPDDILYELQQRLRAHKTKS